MLTDPGDLVVDPFAGSCVTGEVCEHLERKWICIELVKDYLEGAIGRFQRPTRATQYELLNATSGLSSYYKVPRPGALWNDFRGESLPADGGKKRNLRPSRKAARAT